MKEALANWYTRQIASRNLVEDLKSWAGKLKGMGADEIEKVVMEKARARAHEYLVRFHREIIRTILWQNGLLLVSIFPVHWLHSAVPFYIAYGFVVTYTLVEMYKFWPEIYLVLKRRSIRTVAKLIVMENIQQELNALSKFKRLLIDQFMPDLDKLSDDIALEVIPDIKAVAVSTILTLVLAFVAFRLTLIPMLEHIALGMC